MTLVLQTMSSIIVCGWQRHLPDIKHNQLAAFTTVLRSKLLDKSGGFGKEYLKLLASEIRVKGNQAEIRGGYSALAHTVSRNKNGHS